MERSAVKLATSSADLFSNGLGATAPDQDTTRDQKDLSKGKRGVIENPYTTELLSQIDQLNRQKAMLEERLNAVTSSKSWKLTAPLRGCVALIRPFTRLLRFRKVEFGIEPITGTAVRDGSHVDVVGPSPALLLVPKKGARSPNGWVMVSGVIDSTRDPASFLLHFRDRKSGFDAGRRAWVTLSKDGSTSTLVRLPADTHELRLDPFDVGSSFTVKSLQVKEVGTAQAFSKLLKQKTPEGASKLSTIKLWTMKGLAAFRRGGFKAIRDKVVAYDPFTQSYQEWVRRYDTLDASDRSQIKDDISTLKYQPKISILMPVYNTAEQWLRAAIESVLRQLYPHWELCIADDNSSEPHVRTILKEYTARDARIKLVTLKENGHISKATNAAAEISSGEFVSFLDHDDELSEHALYAVVKELNDNSSLDLLYSDEDKMTTFGMRFNPYFKSGWNPELILSQNYLCHFLTVRKSLFEKVGRLRSTYDGAQDWDLALRVIDHSSREKVRHIPFVLYHWRVIETSTAHSTGAKPYVMKAQKGAVEDHLARRGISGAQVEILHDISQIKVSFPTPHPEPLVSVIIPTRDHASLLQQCVEGLLHDTDYKNLEVLIVDNGSVRPETFALFDKLTKDGRVRVCRDDRPFNYSRLNNEAAKIASGGMLAFLNNDLEVTDAGWLTEMVSLAVRPEVGAVGARLLFPNGLLQHAGIITGIGGVAGHNHKGRPKHDPGYFNRSILRQNLSGVTAACMVVRRDVFDQVNGFEEGALSVAFNDVDLCLKIREAGYLNVYTPYAELIHHESASRGYETTPEKFARFESEVETMKRRWGDKLRMDPYYNPNLTLTSEDFTFAFPPRVDKPWRTRTETDKDVQVAA